MPTDRILLDTHVLLWWKAGAQRLSATARHVLATAGGVLVSPISAWEIAMLAARSRIRLDRPVDVWVDDVLAADGVDPAPFTTSMAVVAAGLTGFHGDPADRFLVATSAGLDVPLMTKDRLIHRYADETGGVSVVW